MSKSENGMAQQENITTQTTILLAAKKNKPNDPNQPAPAPVDHRQKSSKPFCQNLLNDVDALLNGRGKEVNNPNDYKVEGRSLLPDGLRAIKSSIESRIADLRSDRHNLAGNHREIKNAHPVHGSYEGHQNFVKDQQAALRMALTKLEKSCKNFTAEEQALIGKAKQAVKTPTPQEPDPKFRQKSATASESQTLRRVIDKIPFISKEQKDATRKALESAGVPRIIKDSINGGKDYWEKTGKPALKTALDTLVNTGKIAAVIAVFILEFVGKLATGQLVSNPQDTTETPSIASTDKTVNPDSNTSSVSTPVTTTSTNTSENKQPISSAPFTGTIPNNQSNFNSQPFTDTIPTSFERRTTVPADPTQANRGEKPVLTARGGEPAFTNPTTSQTTSSERRTTAPAKDGEPTEQAAESGEKPVLKARGGVPTLTARGGAPVPTLQARGGEPTPNQQQGPTLS